MTKSHQAYPTDLNDSEFDVLVPYLPEPKATGRPREHSWRIILNAIFYIVRSGCAWRMLPHDLPPWKTIYHYFRLWRKDGTWDQKRVTGDSFSNPQRISPTTPSA